MHTKIMFAGACAALIAAPFVASAASIADLQAEIASLLAQIQALQVQGSASTSVATSASALVAPASSSCPSFARSLSIGSRGNDVSALQTFLNARRYLNVSATGYFGSLTQAAVGKWQAQSGITASTNAGFGVFGPLSRSYLARSCGQGTQATQPFSADPISGAAPLAVTFTTNDSITSSSTYAVNFGDGSTNAMTKGSCIAITAIVGGQGGIRCSYTAGHTYSTNGIYTAKLLKQTPSKCPAGLMCAQSEAMMLPAPQVVGTATITVGTSTPTVSNIQQLNAPGSVTLQTGGIAEIRNESFYFTLNTVTASTATIQVTPVGCWNSFPSDTPPAIRCMIATILIPPQTLSLGQAYTDARYGITLSQINNGAATFSVAASSATQN